MLKITQLIIVQGKQSRKNRKGIIISDDSQIWQMDMEQDIEALTRKNIDEFVLWQCEFVRVIAVGNRAR